MLAVAAVVLVVGFGLVTQQTQHEGGTPWATGSSEVVDAARAGPVGDASAAPAAGERGHDRPCVLRADCAGALALGGLGLVLALPALTPSPGSPVTPSTPVAGPSLLLRSTLWAARLHRPPQPS